MKTFVSKINSNEILNASTSNKSTYTLNQGFSFSKFMKVNLLVIMVGLFAIPNTGFSKPRHKKMKQSKVVKAVKRNVLDIEFGTFNYDCPIFTKKSVFIG